MQQEEIQTVDKKQKKENVVFTERHMKELGREEGPKKDRKQTEGVALSPGNNKTMEADTAPTTTPPRPPTRFKCRVRTQKNAKNNCQRTRGVTLVRSERRLFYLVSR